MFATIDESNLPYIKITINTQYLDNNEFENLLNKWENINNRNKNYILLFDTRNCGLINIKYIYKLTQFICDLKKKSNKYLDYSIIYVNNKIVKNLLNLTFKIQKPISYTFITENIADIDIIKKDTQYIINNYKKDKFNSNFYLIYP